MNPMETKTGGFERTLFFFFSLGAVSLQNVPKREIRGFSVEKVLKESQCAFLTSHREACSPNGQFSLDMTSH